MPLDLDAFDLRDAQQLRIALLQEVLDHSSDPRVALEVAIDAEAWIIGKVSEAAEIFQPHLLRDAVRPIVAELMASQTVQTITVAPLQVTLPAPFFDKPKSSDRPEQTGQIMRADTLVSQPARSGETEKESPKSAAEKSPPQSNPSTGRIKGLCPSEQAIFEKISTKLNTRIFGAADVSALSGQLQSSSLAVLSRLLKLGLIERIGHGQYSTLDRKPLNTKSPSAQDLIAQHIAEKGVLGQPDFGNALINCLYPDLVARGHTLNRSANRRHFICDQYKHLDKGGAIKWMKDIVARERPTRDIAAGPVPPDAKGELDA